MTKDIWRVWICSCGNQMTINYHANDEDYQRFKACGCGSEYRYDHEYEGEEV